MGRTVLLIHAAATLRTIVHLHLPTDGGHDVVEARDLAAAVTALRGREIDVAIADVSSADEAATLVATLRAERGARALPIVIVAPRPGRAMREVARSAGACAVVSKPLTGPRLRTAIARVLGAP